MPYDANLVLRDGEYNLTSGESAAVILTTANGYGAKCIDLGTTTLARGNAEGSLHLVATLVLPSIPTTYQVNMTLSIQQSDNLSFGWETIATFTKLYSYTRLIKATVTTPFVIADLDSTLTSGTVSDTATLRWMHPDMLTSGKTAHVIINMDASDDEFNDATEEIQGNSTGRATMVQVSTVEAKPRLGGPGTWHRAFAVQKRYLRPLTVVSGGSFGKGQILLSPYPFKQT